ncbi:MAG TPA: NADH-quinone oxidoreductase subunit NuoF [candidate division Zixibacteria bacterium]|nr:NADH-quinone oxidoreductase subunit NuoF [candidate division Zixibacteria bacterium]
MIKRICVGMNSCGIAAGAEEIKEVLLEHLKENKIDIPVINVGCIGMCYREPLLDIVFDDVIYTYGDLTADKVKKIVEQHVIKGKIVEDFLVKKDTFEEDKRKTWDIDKYFSKQVKIILENSGYINPESIDEYIKTGGYKALEKAFTLKPEEIIDILQKSGLRGRGGAGFPTGLKWRFTREAKGDPKYIVCNADEGDPGAFMNRNVLEGDPHRVIEGMIVGAYVIGAKEGFIYCRAEYPLAVKRLQIAIEQAKEKGFLGENILGSGFSFELSIMEGAGAFVCGEETALLASLSGKRGMPNLRPPYPSTKGYLGKPTNINNVETWANVPWILRNGWQKFAVYGSEKSKGTKVFALAGKIKRGGNVEVPMGISIKEILVKIGGGTKSGKPLKAVQMGGPSGGCIPYALFDTPIDYDSINATGAIMGSGGMVVMDEDSCMIDIAKFFLDFTVDESCGKCTYCRLGTKRMWEILDKFSKGEGTREDFDKLLDLAPKVKSGSLCGLGQTAPNPILTTIKYFRAEYEAHIQNKKCPAKVCKPLLTYTINDDCTGCGACLRKCPSDAISGEKKQKHLINQDLCIQCGACYQACRFEAIDVE